MPRVIIGVLDSFGVGAADDAAQFGDEGANTFGSILKACASGKGDIDGLRSGPLSIRNLLALGLGELAEEAAGTTLPLGVRPSLRGAYGFAAEQGRGKDTPGGHWEMMGAPVDFDWAYFPKGPPSFPAELLSRMCTEADLPGLLGNKHASGTTILEELGEEHIRTGKPIVYTSGDSVFQIAAHEIQFGLDRLYSVCEITRRLVDAYNVGRVIARPFIGETTDTFVRTGNRRDYATPPHVRTLLDICKLAGREVISIGKISDIFAGQGITRAVKAHGNEDVFDKLLSEITNAPDGSVIFANFVDFDSLYGHRRNVPGYAAALEAFDRRLPELEAALRLGDMALLTADHGCDPTFPGSDHTREFVPIIVFGPDVPASHIGRRESFADMGQSLAAHLGVGALGAGVSFLPELVTS